MLGDRGGPGVLGTLDEGLVHRRDILTPGRWRSLNGQAELAANTTRIKAGAWDEPGRRPTGAGSSGRGQNGRADGDVRGADPADRGRLRPDPSLARFPGRQAWRRRIAVEFSTIPATPDYPEAAWGRRVYTVAALYPGDPDEGKALLQPLLELGEPLVDFTGQMAYRDVQQLFDTVIPFGKHRCYWKSRYLSGLEDDAIDMIVAGNERPPSPNTLSSIWNFGGATAAVDASATALGDRSMPCMVSIDSIWDTADQDTDNIAWTRAFWERLGPFSDRGRIYLNFAGHGEDNDELTRRTFGSNYERLADIKRRYDPANMFRFNQNIQPAK